MEWLNSSWAFFYVRVLMEAARLFRILVKWTGVIMKDCFG